MPGTIRLGFQLSMADSVGEFAFTNGIKDDVLGLAAEPEPYVVKMFRVFDGHGGNRVAQYAATYMGSAVYQQLAVLQKQKACLAGYENSVELSLYTTCAKARRHRKAEVTP